MLFVTESFVESHSSLAPLIDQPKGRHYSNMLANWCLESMEIVAAVRLRLDKSGTICVVVKPVLLDRCVDKYPGIAAPWNLELVSCNT